MFLFTEEQFNKWINSFPASAIIDKTRKPESFPCMLIWCTHESNNYTVIEYELICKRELEIYILDC